MNNTNTKPKTMKTLTIGGTTYEIVDEQARKNKVDKTHAEITGSLSMGRKAGTKAGTNSTALGIDVTAATAASYAEGAYTQVGCKAFTIIGIQKNSTGTGGKYFLDSVDGLQVGDVYSVHIYYSNDTSSQAENHGKITAIDTTAKSVTVDNFYTVDGRTFATKTSYIDDGLDNEQNSFRIVSKPEVGNRILGYAAHAEGKGNKAYLKASHAEGQENISYGSYAHTEGTKNSAGYCAHAEGAENTASGFWSHAEGKGSSSSGNLAHAEGAGTTASGRGSHTEGNQTEASGDYAHAEGGKNTKALGAASHAEGLSTEATGKYSHAEGNSTKAIASQSHTEGHKSTATGENAHAEGYKTVAKGTSSHAENRETMTYGDQSHAEGYLTHTIGNASHAEGIGANVLLEDITVDTSIDDILSAWRTTKFNLARGKGSHTEGKNALALGDNSHAEGEQTVSYGADSHAEGRSSEAIGNNSHTEGYGTKTIGSCSHAEGSMTTCTGNNSHVEGYNTQANENQAHAEGHSSIASGKSSHAEGQETVASGYTGHAEGYRTVASGLYSHIEGQSSNINEEVFETNNDLIIKWGNVKFSRAIGNASHVEGRNSLAIGSVSHAEGHQNLAAGPASHAEGEQTIATGYYTHAEGKVAKASGNASHAEGCETNAGGSSSHAEGYKTNAYGDSSHAEGNYSTATGNWSHAQGFHADTSGLCAHAEGYYTSAISKYQHVQGKYNKYDSVNKYAHIVGNGTSTTDRNNAHTLDWTGNAWFQGSVTSNGADYAEFFEWLDGNPDSEDRVGMLVTLDGEKMKLANSGDEILGIISATAAVLGDNYECDWNGKYLTDDFGRILYEEVEEFVETPKTTISEILNEETGEVEISEMTEMETRSLGIFKHPKINPDYDPEQAYVNRANRPEWNTVGMVGKLYLRDDGTCEVNSYATVGADGIATASAEKTNIRVLTRVNENVVRVLLK